ncbi:hypothetical protein HAX54_018635 [Datura stramonium]|uniref:Uncharacterized protein n=1 Tax=Datura stramonium TaxID=4076 RepID=A0ABS8UMN5_DATST|nr:hypothetical protein [Datura stramonium]
MVDDSEFEFDTDVPNRLISQYFGDDNIRPVSKVEFVEKFKKVWLYECCSRVDPKIATKVGNRIPRLLNWKTNDDHPRYENLIQGMFSNVKNPLVFRNIVPTLRELSILELPPPFVESHLVYDREGQYYKFEVASHVPPQQVSQYQTPSRMSEHAAHVQTHVEFLSGGKGIANSNIDTELLCNRYASILWDYVMKKIEVDSMSDDEAPPRKIKSIVESNSSDRIVLS